MKKNIFLRSLTGLIFCFALAVFNFSSAKAENRIAQTYYAPNMAIAYDTFIDAVNTKIPQLNIQKFYGNQIVSSKNLLDSVESDMVYIGHIVPHMYSKIKAGNIIAAMPFVTKDAKDAAALFYGEKFIDFVEQEFDKYGLKCIGITWASPYHLLTKKKINSLADLDGLKIRAIGTTANVLSQFGAVCLSTAPEDLYMALEDGTLDGVVLGSAYEYKQADLHETAKWYNLTPLADPVVDYLVMSKKNWDLLSENEQKIMIEEAQKVQNIWYEQVSEMEQILRDTLFKDTCYSFGDEDVKKLQYAVHGYLSELMANDLSLEQGINILMKHVQK